jgi:hypothetical protein
MPSIEFSKGPDGQIIDTTQILVAGDLAKLNALSDPDSGIVRVDYLLVPEIAGASPNYVTNIATRGHGATEYDKVLHENADAMLDITHPIDIRNKVE